MTQKRKPAVMSIKKHDAIVADLKAQIVGLDRALREKTRLLSEFEAKLETEMVEKNRHFNNWRSEQKHNVDLATELRTVKQQYKTVREDKEQLISDNNSLSHTISKLRKRRWYHLLFNVK
jgi:site-specific DNA-adenine methylase